MPFRLLARREKARRDFYETGAYFTPLVWTVNYNYVVIIKKRHITGVSLHSNLVIDAFVGEEFFVVVVFYFGHVGGDIDFG